MKMFSSLLAILLLLTLSTSALAQDDDEYEKDFMEVAFFGGGSMPMGGLSDWTTTNSWTGIERLGTNFGISFGFDVGHFLTNNLVVGLTFSVSRYSIDSDSSAVASLHHRLISPAAYFKYYFVGEGNAMPYIKAHAGVDVAKYTTRVFDGNIDNGALEYRELSYPPAFAFGFGAGFFYYTHDYGGLYAEANYHTALTSGVTGDYQGYEYPFGETASVLDIHAGIKVFFGSD